MKTDHASGKSIDAVALIISLAGGTIVGRTKLQKVAYLLDAAGFETGFNFEYKRFGPYSADLASDAKIASLLGVIQETEQPASWGGTYSIYECSAEFIPPKDLPPFASELARVAADANAIDLELAATAIFLSGEGFADPWAETERRKPDKVTTRGLDGARLLIQNLQSIQTAVALPKFG